MAEPTAPEPVKLFVAILWNDAASLRQAMESLARQRGPMDFTGQDHPFDATPYYAAEMGEQLWRRLVAFQILVAPEELVAAKLACNALERELAQAGKRRVNLDVGYLDHGKIVLASAKGAGQKIYLGSGIHADLVGRYARGKYEPFEWTFPDFRQGIYDAELAAIRRGYLDQRRGRRRVSEQD